MTIDIARLRAKWGWSSLFSILPFAVMARLDAAAKGATGLGVLDLQFAATQAKTRQVLEAWSAAGVNPQIGFSLGIDYLFMLLYAVASSRWAPSPVRSPPCSMWPRTRSMPPCCLGRWAPTRSRSPIRSPWRNGR